MLKNGIRDPLLLFLLMGAALFAASHWLTSQRETRERQILITPALAAHQANLHQAQLGAAPDATAQEALIQAYVRDEALYREAKRLGLEQEDSVIRQRLIQKMEVLLTDATPVPNPSDVQLAQFLQAHAARYQIASRVSFEQRYFAALEGRKPEPAVRAAAALSQLSAGQATTSADNFALGNDFTDIDSDELVSRFGESEMAQAPLTTPLNHWAGPFKSGYGLHLIRVTQRTAGTLPPLNALREQLLVDWSADFRERERERRVAELIARHEVLRLDQAAQ